MCRKKNRQLRGLESGETAGLHWARGGQGPINAVLLGGFGQPAELYRALVGALGKQCTVWVVDLPGMGGSMGWKLDWRKMTTREIINVYADAIDAFIQQTGLGKIHLIGHSMGAYMGFFFTHKYPERVLTMTAISAGGMVAEPKDFRERLKTKKLPTSTKIARGMWEAVNKGWIRGKYLVKIVPLRWMIDKWTKEKFEFKDDEREAALDLITGSMANSGYAWDVLPKIFGYRAYSPLPVESILAEVQAKTPVLHIVGTRDWMDRHALTNLINKTPGKSTFKLLPEGTHQMTNLQPFALASLILPFITQQ